MRHQKSGRKLNRNSSHREAMFRNMVVSLFRHEQIRTTLPKAKELRRFAEPLITLAKKSSVANHRLAFDRLRDRKIVLKLFNDLGVRFKDRPGGYLRILKCGFRGGDNAPMAIVQLVDGAVAVETTSKKELKAKAPAAEGKPAKVEKPAKKEKAEAKPKKPTKKKTTKKAATKKTAKKKMTKKAAPKKKKTTKKKVTKKKS